MISARSIYLRTLRDLTLHGGIDPEGRLILLPVFSGLGVKGIKQSDYLRQSEQMWRDGHLKRILQQVDLPLEWPEIYRVLYPALTVSLPVPSAAVIDHILASESAETSKTVAYAQVARSSVYPRWRIFRFPGAELNDELGAAVKLMAVESDNPDLLTQNFRSILEAIIELDKAITQAENEQNFVVMEGCEIGVALHEYGWPCMSDVSPWSRFYEHLKDKGDHVKSTVAKAKNRVGASDVVSLQRQLNRDRTLWSILPDIGAESMLMFARSVESAQGRGVIWPLDTSISGDIEPYYSYDDTSAVKAKRNNNFPFGHRILEPSLHAPQSQNAQHTVEVCLAFCSIVACKSGPNLRA